METTTPTNFEEVLEAAAKGDKDVVNGAMFEALRSKAHSDTLLNAVFAALTQLADVSKDIAIEAHRIERNMQQVRSRIEDGHHINSLGELQNQGTRFDMMCALRAERLSTAKRMIHLFEKS